MAKPTLQDFEDRLNSIYLNLFELLSKENQEFSFRVNLLKSLPSEVIEELTKEGFKPKETIFDDTFTLPIEARDVLPKLRVYTDGKIYIQSLSSILAAKSLDINSSDWVLDLAAAPGGKSLIFAQIAEKVSAVEPNKSRFFSMKRNFKIMGAKNIQTYNKDGRFIYKSCSEWFDKVFLDAPCSSEAHIDLKKGITWWSMRRVYKFAKLQKELIVSAFESLNSGGEMIYATCTFAPEENEAVVNYLLNRYSNAKLIAIDHKLEKFQKGLIAFKDEKFDNSLELTIRILPHKSYSGFYMAKIVKL